MEDFDLDSYIHEGVKARESVKTEYVRKTAALLYEKISKGGKLIAMGNGGSAADAQHFAAELTGHFAMERKPFPALALNANSSAITAIGNDYSFDKVFERQVLAFAGPDDFVVGITTSGNSPNVLNAIGAANRIGAFTLGMTGRSGGKLKDVARDIFQVESDRTPIIQEVHIAFIHMVCLEFDRLFSKDSGTS